MNRLAAATLALVPAVLMLARTFEAQERGPTATRTDAAERGVDFFVAYSAGADVLLADSRDAGLERVLDLVRARLSKLSEAEWAGLRKVPAGVGKLVGDVIGRPWCLRIGARDDAHPEDYHVQWTVVFPRVEDARAVANALDSELRGLGLHSRPTDAAARGGSEPWAQDAFRIVELEQGPLFFGADGDARGGRLRVGLRRLLPEDFLLEGAGEAAPELYLRYDGRRAGRWLESAVGGVRRGGSTGAESALTTGAFELLGLIGDTAPTRTLARSRAGGRATTVSRVDGWRAFASARGLFTEEPIGPEDWGRIPADATLARLVQVRCAGLLGLVDRFDPDARAQLAGMARAATGVDLQTELLDHLGPTAGFYWSRGTGGGGLLSSVAFIETSAPARVAESVGRIARFAVALAGPRSQGRVALREWRHGDVDCTSLVFPGLPVPFELSWAVTADALIGAAGPGALAGALEQLARETGVLDHPALAALPERPWDAASSGGLARFAFTDTAHFVERGYAPLSLLASALANGLRTPGGSATPAAEPGTLLPSYGDLTRGIAPTVGWGRVLGGDLVTTVRSEASWTVGATALGGTPLSQSYAGIAGLGIVSSLAIPNLMSARSSANESAAIATLRAVASAQAQVRSQASVDTDGDGRGEYAFFGELAGARPLRVAGAGPAAGEGVAAWGGRGDVLQPPYLSTTFGELTDDGAGCGVVERNGYYFQMWLPGPFLYEATGGVAEPLRPDAPPGTDARTGANLWCCYAWPVKPGSTGRRAFFMDASGELLAFDNKGGVYGGLAPAGGHAPDFDAAYTLRSDMGSAPAADVRGRDGHLWARVR